MSVDISRKMNKIHKKLIGIGIEVLMFKAKILHFL